MPQIKCVAAQSRYNSVSIILTITLALNILVAVPARGQCLYAACCYGYTCVDGSNNSYFREYCRSHGGSVRECTGCWNHPCGNPLGSCCSSNGTCQESVRWDDCILSHGLPTFPGLNCDSDRDGDSVVDGCDQCPDDPAKTAPGICGCGVADTDTDGDGIANCRDNCALHNPMQVDCQPNGVGDVCDIAYESSADLNFDSIPDECEQCLFNTDCDDGIFCTGLESCDTGTCVGGDWPCAGQQVCVETIGACLPDCNVNGISDVVDIENELSFDCDGNQIPNECESGPNFEGPIIVSWGCGGSSNYDQCNVAGPNNGFVSFAGGGTHSLGLKADGSIIAWGNNLSGQTDVPVPNIGFMAVAAGGDHSLALKANGSVVAWGWDYYGQTDVPAPNAGFVAIAAGSNHSLGLKANGSVVGWGYNFSGQTNVQPHNFIAVAAGGAHSLGLKTDGSIVAWGYNGNDIANIPSPNSGFTAIAAGSLHNLGLKTDGSIIAWGDNYYGQINVPLPNKAFVAVAAGGYHSLGLKSDGSIVAWGAGGPGQSGVPHYGQSIAPARDSLFVAITGGRYHSLALRADAACCLTTGTCQRLGQIECAALGGVWHGLGSSCQSDWDADSISDVCDNCVCSANSEQVDFDDDGLGDSCDVDQDHDGIVDEYDSCPETFRGLIVDGEGCPVPIGPCCFAANICIDGVDGGDCSLVGGHYLGDGLTCAGDLDADGISGCADLCSFDSNKVAPGRCGCGVAETDSDFDKTPDCLDGCPDDGLKIEPGVCGCGVGDFDTDGDGVYDCLDPCPLNDPDDSDGDDVCDSSDPCPLDNPNDTDGDGVCDSNDGCPFDADKLIPGPCGCGVPDDDSDGDGVADCNDLCADTPTTTDVNMCGCTAQGACCFTVGVCFDGTSFFACSVIHGVYQGDGSRCENGCGIGDFDANGSSDHSDFALFQRCFSGPATLAIDKCLTMDFDGCGNVDLRDYVIFLRAFEVR